MLAQSTRHLGIQTAQLLLDADADHAVMIRMGFEGISVEMGDHCGTENKPVTLRCGCDIHFLLAS